MGLHRYMKSLRPMEWIFIILNHARSRTDGKMHTGKTFTAEVQKDRAAKGLKLTIMIVQIIELHYFQYHYQRETRQSRQYE